MDAIEAPQSPSSRAIELDRRGSVGSLTLMAVAGPAQSMPPHDWAHVATGAGVAAFAAPALSSPLRGAPDDHGRRSGRDAVLHLLLHDLAVPGDPPRDGHSGPSEAGSAVGVADSAFDVMVFALVRDRFGQLNAGQDREHAIEFLTCPEDADRLLDRLPDASQGEQLLLEIVLLGFGVAVALLVLLSAAAHPLGLDTTTDGAPAWARLLLLAGVGALVVVFVLCEYALVWGAVVLSCGGATHHHVAAVVGAGVMGVIAAESILAVSTVLRLRSPTWPEVVLAVLCGVVTTLSIRWLLVSGVWQSTTAAAESVFLVLLGNGLLHLIAGRLIAWPLPDRQRSTEHELNREATNLHVMQDAVNAVILGFVALAIP